MSWPNNFQPAMKRISNSRGFSLVEVLVAIVILASGFVIIAQAMGRTQQAMRISENLLNASLIAEERLSETEIQLRESLKLSSSFKGGTEEFPGGRNFHWNQDITAYSGVEDQTRMKKLDVVVEWNDGPQRKNSERLTSLFLHRDKEETV